MTREWIDDIQKARRDILGPCGVLGCLNVRTRSSKFCGRHCKLWREDKHFLSEGIPRSYKERSYMATLFCKHLEDQHKRGKLSLALVQKGMMEVVYRLLNPGFGATPARGQADTGTMGFLDGQPFRELVRETRRHFWMYRKQPMLGLLIKTPYEFQVAEVREEEGFFKVLLMMRVDHKYDNFEGYLSSRGGFLPKESIKPILIDAFESGRMVFLSCQRSVLHRPPGAPRQYSDELRAQLKKERANRRFLWPRKKDAPGSQT